MTTTTLKTMPYAQATVIIDGGNIHLQSYETIVAYISDSVLVINGLYSMTTRKHIKAFVKEYVPFAMDFDSIKFLANNHVALNLETGEVINL